MTLLRDLANNSVLYQASLRDNYVEANGVPVVCLVPVTENNKNELGDFIEGDRESVTLKLVPRYKQYFQLLSILEESIEDTLPLELIMKTTDDLQKDTILQIDVVMPHNEEVVNQWRVLSSGLKHLEFGYAKVAKAVPRRGLDWS